MKREPLRSLLDEAWDRQLDTERHGLAEIPEVGELLPLDRAWVGGGLEIDDLQVHRTETAAIASDHLPLVANVSVSSASDSSDVRTESRTNSPGSDETSTISP